MKSKLKVILIALIAVILTLISFVGIYINKNGFFENIIKDYTLSKNLKGTREITLVADTSTKEVKYDENGKVVTDTEATSTSTSEESEEAKPTYTTVNEPVNPESVLNKENYILSKDVISKRLDLINNMDVNERKEVYDLNDKIDYKVRVNEENGNILVELPEDSSLDDIITAFNQKGSFDIIDAEDKTVLLDNSNIADAKVTYYQGQNNGTEIYLVIEFDKEGTKKLEEITSKYIATTDDEGNTTEKKITVRMEEEDLFSTYFGTTIKTGQLQLKVGSATTDNETLQTYYKNAKQIATLLKGGKMPVQYTINSEKFVKSVINTDNVNVIVYILLGTLVISFIYLIVKFKKYGALGIISSIIGVDLVLLLIRYTNVSISLETFIAFAIIIIINAIVNILLLKNINDNQNEEERAKVIQKGLLSSVDILATSLIIAIVFAFMNISEIANIGLTMFWGIVSIIITSVVFLRTMLLNSDN